MQKSTQPLHPVPGAAASDGRVRKPVVRLSGSRGYQRSQRPQTRPESGPPQQKRDRRKLRLSQRISAQNLIPRRRVEHVDQAVRQQVFRMRVHLFNGCPKARDVDIPDTRRQAGERRVGPISHRVSGSRRSTMRERAGGKPTRAATSASALPVPPQPPPPTGH
eukprot:scaffold156177_cov31-Tisochrysis_lutea.AAC.10